MKDNIQLIHLTEKHLDHVLSIEQQSFLAPWNRKLFLDELACPQAFNYIAIQQNNISEPQIRGYLCFRIFLDEMHMMRIAVNPNYRHQGIGCWMLAQGMDIAKHHGAMVCYLEVNESNHVAIHMYKKNGFRCIGRRPKYYSETNEDGLVFQKNLNESL